MKTVNENSTMFDKIIVVIDRILCIVVIYKGCDFTQQLIDYLWKH